MQRFTVDLAPGQTSGSVPVGYVADQRADYRRLVTQVTAWPTRNVMTDGYLGELAVIDDDPRPALSVRSVARQVPAGSPARWRVRLDKPVDFDLSVTGKVVQGPGTPVRVADIGRSWTDLHAGPVAPGKSLWASHAMTYDVIDPGRRRS